MWEIQTSQNPTGDLESRPTHHDEVLDLEEGLLLEASDSLDRPAILCPTWMGSGLSCCVLVAILARHSSCNDAALGFTVPTVGTAGGGGLSLRDRHATCQTRTTHRNGSLRSTSKNCVLEDYSAASTFSADGRPVPPADLHAFLTDEKTLSTFNSVNPEITLELNLKLLPRTGGYKCTVSKNALMTYGAPRPPAGEELRVRAVHRGRN